MKTKLLFIIVYAFSFSAFAQIGFEKHIISTEANSAFSADIDNDGDMDIIIGDDNLHKISWYENINGQGNFGSEQVITTEDTWVNLVYSVDIDNDGDMDILSASSSSDSVSWYENLDGVGNFGSVQVITMDGDSPWSVYSADFDGDGAVDILSASVWDDKIAWFRNLDGQGNFGSQQIITTNADYARSVFAADINGDGYIDVLSASQFDNKVAWYENLDGQGNFGSQQIISISNSATSVHAADIDNDGDMDVLSANGTEIFWYENLDGVGDFSEPIIIRTHSGGVASVYAIDIDTDGDMDVFSSSYSANEIVWSENLDGLGSFGTEQIITSDSDYSERLVFSDMDNDGDMDLLSGSGNSDNLISWYENLGELGNEINGNVKLDLASNGCDINDLVFSNTIITSDNGSDTFATFTQEDGGYQIAVGEGDFTTSLLQLSNYYVSIPISYDSSFLGSGNIDTAEFCLEPIGVVNDLNISIYPLNDARPGFDSNYRIIYKNVGTSTLSGSVELNYNENDGLMDLVLATPNADSDVANILTWSYSDLMPFESREILVTFNLNTPTETPPLSSGDAIGFVANVFPLATDETLSDNSFQLKQIVINSYDPNDIRVLEGEEILFEDIDKYLHYIIRFQNTGTASAINIRVNNLLDDKLDWTTMQLESLSHSGRVEITNGSNVDFIFSNIQLSDSTSDEPNSHGFIAYKIKPKTEVIVGDIFYNTADIFFDFNPAIVTNTESTEIVENLSVDEFELQNVLIYPNPTNRTLHIDANDNITSIKVYNLLGQQILTTSTNAFTDEIDMSKYNSGVYLVKVEIEGQTDTYRVIKK